MAFAFKMDLAGTMQQVLGVLSKQLVTVDTGLGKVTASVGAFEKSFMAVEGAKALGRAALWAVEHVAALGKEIVKINAEAQDLNLAARLQLGPDGAEMLQRVADSFSNTRFDDDAIKQALLPLANAGIKDEETLDNIATVAADISARFNTGQAGFEAATEALGKIALRREVGERQLQALGVNEGEFMATLSKSLGQSVAATKKAVAAGKVAAPTLLNAAMKTIADKQGGAIGVAALEGGKTLGATLQRLSDLPANLFKQLADSPGLAKVQAAIEGIMASLSGDRGAALVQRLGDGITRVFEVATPERIIGAFETLIDLVEGSIVVAGYLGDTFKLTGEFIGVAAAEIYLHAVSIYNAIAGAVEWIAALPGKAYDAGAAIVNGIVNGIKSGISAVGDAISSVATGAIDSLKSALGIASPSRVFAELGGQTAEGFALGITGGTDDVKAATRALTSVSMPRAAPSLPSMGGAAGAMSGAGLSVVIGDVIVQSNATDPAGVARDVRQELTAMWRGIAAEMGAA